MVVYPLITSPDRLSHWSAADFGVSSSVEQANTRAELGYVCPGRVTSSLGNSSLRFHDSALESATVFASASGRARNFSAHTGASAATTATSDCSFAILSAVLLSDQPPQPKPTIKVTAAPPTAPCSKRFSDSPWRIAGTCTVSPFSPEMFRSDITDTRMGSASVCSECEHNSSFQFPS